MGQRTSGDPYLYPGTDVLKNDLGLRTAKELEDAEVGITTPRLAELQRAPVKGSFDISHYTNTHYAIFKGVYPFAGEFRTVELHKWSEQRQDYTTFMPAEIIVPWLNRHLNEEVAKRGRFRELGRDEFVERTARLYLDLNAFHPFREGNGRTQREFLRTLGLNAGYEIQWTRIDKDGEFLDATIRSAHDKKDRSLHEQLSKAIVNPPRDLRLQAAWDRYMGGENVTLSRASVDPDWRGTLAAAIRASEQAAPGPAAFVSGDWEKYSRIRVYTGGRLLESLKALDASGRTPAVYAVRDDGAVHNTVTGRDEYLRLDANRHDLAPRLQKAADRHFTTHPESHAPTASRNLRDPDIDVL
jgi:cell filamentation protein